MNKTNLVCLNSKGENHLVEITSNLEVGYKFETGEEITYLGEKMTIMIIIEISA
ncbi:MAG: hypothetical protein Q9M94_05540 [Candidatus Gracilibacteria bacterium]|nr:hypothetical protein [Candidatus Gracilibacteria bacterium]MDQ7023084.1 hypothetical protein [Candidatus Gracilibacteria bacterium]